MFEQYDIEKMPGHWVLARMGKKVLRPGGRELTEDLIAALRITSDDAVVEFAPGIGHTAQAIFKRTPLSYIGVDQNEEAIKHLASLSPNNNYVFVNGNVRNPGIGEGTATVVLGEAILTMQTEESKQAVVSEAYRLLKSGGRYGIHEIALQPDTIDEDLRARISGELSREIHVGARPLTSKEWTGLLTGAGFKIETILEMPMHMLNVSRVVRDEGVLGTARIAFNVATTPNAARRIAGMRNIFTRYHGNLSAIGIVATKE